MEKEYIIIEKLNKIFAHVNKESKKPRDYGVGFPLYQSEIHTIEAIHNYKGLKLSKLSSILGIANSSLNEMTSKLISKGLIEKYKSERNKKEVFYRLTALGELANKSHKIYHKDIYNNISNYINSKTSEDVKNITDFLDTLISIL